jgi:hypothetical protein
MICEPKPTTVYIVEHPDGLCRIHLSPTQDMIGSGVEREFEEELRAEFVWVERLGIILLRRTCFVRASGQLLQRLRPCAGPLGGMRRKLMILKFWAPTQESLIPSITRTRQPSG